IALIMHFGCPTREEPENQPLHYKTLLYFHSDSDWTTIGGRANERDAVIAGASGGLAAVALAWGKKHQDEVWFKTPIFGFEIKRKYISYPIGTALALTSAMYMNKIKNQVNRTNDFPAQKGKVTVGFRIQIDGKNPGHSPIVNICQRLPEIIETALQQYPTCYASSGRFSLNLSTDPENKNPIYLHIEKIGYKTMVSVIDNLIRDAENNSVIIEEEVAPEKRGQELKISKIEEKRYKRDYNKA
ncbi:MAG: hypothetical protein ACYC2U_08800, partial [Candidatus Amoebophilus sp.]